MLQASWGSVAFAFAQEAPEAASSLQSSSKPPGGATPILVSVIENSPKTVINLGAAFSGVNGLQHADGLKFSVLGNTNSGLVKPTLSEAALSLTYTGGKSGTATITVCATDADGVSAKRTVQVTVRPLIAALPLPGSPVQARPPVARAPGMPW